MANTPKYLDLDAIDNEVELVVKLGGQEHQMVPISVEDYIKNTHAIQKLAAAPSQEAETELVIGMLLRSFPTMTKAMLYKLPLVNLNKIMAYANENNGSGKVENDAKKDAEANPQSAG